MKGAGCRFDRIALMKLFSQITLWILLLFIGMTVFPSRASALPSVADLTGQWQGRNRFRGISYEEASQKRVTVQDVVVVLHFSAAGKVTGQVGEAELTGTVQEAHRDWFSRLIRQKSNFIIVGQLVGAVAPHSESGTHPVNVPFTFTGSEITGSLFVVYPMKYPFPFLGIHLSRSRND